MLEVTANDRQSDEALMREFWRHVRKSGRLQESRGRRAYEPKKSRNMRRRAAQQKSIRQQDREYQMKIGRISPGF